ncbi:uncharacterized protein FIBRA_00580 [Fibroporia radiculosa]|uniref:FAD dependent oxidoreductase domain-containing protein n=1 Tax=Fibroporia radiculosa TaxID=599839 RepID=J4H097_9APHY|nr:uncharacterized protein FIBRA_00580 [Fibroporia radiculosa]CCL98579.1 predicted protein [Fibroporia radiculosa]
MRLTQPMGVGKPPPSDGRVVDVVVVVVVCTPPAMPSTVILGGGIVGLATAYYLATLTHDTDPGASGHHDVHLVEPCPELFASASGHAGGFLAEDWFNPALAPLGALSFRLHRELAQAHTGRALWGWSETVSYSLDRNASIVTTDSDGDPDIDLGAMDDDDGDGDGAGGSDLDSEPPLSPDPASLPDSELEILPRALLRRVEAHRGGQEEVDTTRRIVLDDEDGDALFGLSRVPVVEQRTADALAAAEVAAEAQAAAEAAAQATAEAEAEAEADAAADAAVAATAEQARLESPYWLTTPSHAAQAISDRTTTSQINPHQLCEFLLEKCLSMGVHLHHPARAAELVHADPSDPDSRTLIRLHLLATTSTGRELRRGTLDVLCDSLVLAAGCWTPDVFSTLFPHAPRVPAVQRLGGHSIVVRTRAWQPPPPDTPDAASVPCHAIYTSDPSGFSPEVYARAGGEIWIGGLNTAVAPLPARASDAKVAPESVARLVALAQELIGEDIELVESGLCFRPISPSGKPMIVQMSEKDLGGGIAPKAGGPGVGGGVFLATGHGPWGISLSLGTGLVVSEMILGRPTSTDIRGLNKW